MLGTLNPRQIDRLLHEAIVGRIGVTADGKTYVVPITYVYDGDSIYGHSLLGQKVAMMRKNPRVCFEVEQIDDLANWRTVIAQADFEELTGDLAVAAARLIAARLGPLTPSDTAGPRPRRPGVRYVSYRLRLREKTGRYERKTPPRRRTVPVKGR